MWAPNRCWHVVSCVNYYEHKNPTKFLPETELQRLAQDTTCQHLFRAHMVVNLALIPLKIPVQISGKSPARRTCQPVMPAFGWRRLSTSRTASETLPSTACDTMRRAALLTLTLWSGLLSLHAFTRLGPIKKLAVLHSSSPIETYESLWDVESIRLVDEELRVGGLGHTLYCRLSRGPSSSAELAIDAILQLRQDESPFVEYW
jgi:hypothetical protein